MMAEEFRRLEDQNSLKVVTRTASIVLEWINARRTRIRINGNGNGERAIDQCIDFNPRDKPLS